MINESKFIGTASIMERVFRDNGYDIEVHVGEVIEWIGDAIGMACIPTAFIERVTNGLDGEEPPIEIENYRGIVPCDFHKSVEAREYTRKLPMVWTSDVYHATIPVANTVEPPATYDNIMLRYDIVNNIIRTSFQSGQVELKYIAFSVDEQGFPMIPDDTKMIRAIKAFVTKQIDYRLWRQGKLRSEVYEASQREWLFAVASAKTGALTPNVDEMEALKNQLLRLIPDMHAHNTQFKFASLAARQRNINSR